MTLLTPEGRYDRSAVIDRAKRLMTNRCTWGDAMRQAYQEAKQEAQAAPVGGTAINCRRLAHDAEKLMVAELERR